MNSVVAKMFINSETIGPDQNPTSVYSLGVVCRGDLNKDWAAATPSGSAKMSDPALDAVWAAKRAGERALAEVYVRQVPDSDGDWKMESCAFSYGGCIVVFRRTWKDGVGGELSLTVNAKPATAVLRQAFADGLIAGDAPRFRIEIEAAEDAPASA